MSKEEFDEHRAHLLDVSRGLKLFERVMARLPMKAALEALEITARKRHITPDDVTDRRERQRQASKSYRQRHRASSSPSSRVIDDASSNVIDDASDDATVVSSSVVGSGSEASKQHKIRELLQKYDEGFLAKFGSRPVIAGGKDAKLAQKILRIHGDDALRLIAKFFESDDDFIQNSGYSFGVFHSVVNKLVAQDAPKKVPLIPRKQAEGLQAWLEMKEAGHDITGYGAVRSVNGRLGRGLRGGDGAAQERGLLPGPE